MGVLAPASKPINAIVCVQLGGETTITNGACSRAGDQEEEEDHEEGEEKEDGDEEEEEAENERG